MKEIPLPRMLIVKAVQEFKLCLSKGRGKPEEFHKQKYRKQVIAWVNTKRYSFLVKKTTMSAS